MNTIQELRDQLKQAETRLYKLKTKAAKNKQRDVVLKIRLEMQDAILKALEPYLNKRHEGIIISGGTDCLAETEFGLVPVYAINDKNSKSWYEETCCVSYKEGDKITFEIKHPRFENGHLMWFAADVEGGTFDENKYNELCKLDNLAFFKKPDGSMTGLFK